MLLFVQFIQVSRNMTTYENMFGVDHHSASALNSAFTSTGAPLAGVNPGPLDQAAGHQGHGHNHNHGGFLKTWSKLLGVDTFIETATGRGAAAGGKNKKNKRNPYSKGCMTNCKDFWCDPAPVFGKRETGSGMLDGRPVNWTEIYESPALMDAEGAGRGGRRRGGYEVVAGEEV
jgi:palmitoyltransferase